MNEIDCVNNMDGENPTGGNCAGIGLNIQWQNGPRYNEKTKTLDEKNGAFVEDVISAAIQRLEFFQTSKFWCDENKVALQSLYAALGALKLRTKNRESRGIEGTHRF